MITRKEYMKDSSKLHHSYFLQFATDQTYAIVKRSIGIKAIAESTCPNMNDIPLRLWDEIHPQIKGSVKRALKVYMHSYGCKSFNWSLSDSVCVAKAVARELKKEVV